MSRHGALLCSVVAFVLAACTGQTRYHRFLPLPAQGWGRQDTLLFQLPDSMAGDGLQMHVELRAMRSFPYTDLWLALEQCDSAQRLLHTDTIRFLMTDSEGALSGRGQDFIEYASSALVLASDSVSRCTAVRIRHLMSSETVTGLADVGVKVTSVGL